MNCPLCNNQSTLFYSDKKRVYHLCDNCSAIFMNKNFILNKTKEKERYENHNNDINDIGYQNFVSPITEAILKDFNSDNSIGLDFGAGKGPVATKILEKSNFNIKLYDPFFHNNSELLKKKYNFIILSEVMEHFNNPYKEFDLLKKLLLPNGKIYCMTSLYNKNINFKNWYYKNDSTHVFIYQNKTIEWIKNHFDFSKVKIQKKLIIFYN